MSSNPQSKAVEEQSSNKGYLLAGGLTYGGVAKAYLELLKLQNVLLKLAQSQAKITKVQLEVGNDVVQDAAAAAKDSIEQDATNLRIQAITSGATAGVTVLVTGYGVRQENKIMNETVKPATNELERLDRYKDAMGNPATQKIGPSQAENTDLQAAVGRLKAGDVSGEVNPEAVRQLEGRDPEGFKTFKKALEDKREVYDKQIQSGYTQINSGSVKRQLLSQFGQQASSSVGQGIQSIYTVQKAAAESRKAILQGALQTNIDVQKSSKQMSDKIEESNSTLQLAQSLLTSARLQA